MLTVIRKHYKKTISFDGSSLKKPQLSKMTVENTLYNPNLYGGLKR
jgi:hypothetical protein